MSGRPSSSNSWINSACSERNEDGRNRDGRIKDAKGSRREKTGHRVLNPCFPRSSFPQAAQAGCCSQCSLDPFCGCGFSLHIHAVSLSFPSIVSSSVPSPLLSTLLLFPEKAAVLGETSTICSAVVSNVEVLDVLFDRIAPAFLWYTGVFWKTACPQLWVLPGGRLRQGQKDVGGKN